MWGSLPLISSCRGLLLHTFATKAWYTYAPRKHFVKQVLIASWANLLPAMTRPPNPSTNQVLSLHSRIRITHTHLHICMGTVVTTVKAPNFKTCIQLDYQQLAGRGSASCSVAGLGCPPSFGPPVWIDNQAIAHNSNELREKHWSS